MIDFARNIDWGGSEAKTVEAGIPSGVSYPIKLDRVYVAALENTELEMRRLYFADSLVAVYPIDAGNVNLPESTRFTDRKKTELGQERRAFTDIVLLGDIVSENPPDNYKSIQNRSITEFNTIYGQTFGIYFGDPDNTVSKMPAYRKTSSTYNSYRLGDVDFISLTAAKGSMFSSNTEQWKNAERLLLESGNSIMVLFDVNPLTSMPSKELELLQQLFVNSGKNVIVVSAEGTNTSTTINDGVWYINLGALFHDNGNINEGFKTLRVRFFEDDFRYSLK